MSSGRASSSASSLPPGAHAIAGAVGGALATWMFYPLELIRVEMQARGKKSNNASQDEGENEGECQQSTSSSEQETNLECLLRLYKKQALYRGASSMVTTMLISSFITFYSLEVTRRSMQNLLLRQTENNRMQIEQQRTKGIRQIYRLQNHIKFLSYLLPKSKMGASLLASTLTGILNVLLTTPLWNGTRRIMESDVIDAPSTSSLKQVKQPNLWEMMHQIANNEGIIQLWHGTWSSLLLVSNPAIQYFLYEQIRVWVLGIKHDRLVRRRNRHRGSGREDVGLSPLSLQLTAKEAFVFGALSKTVATVVTYPLQLAQVLIRLRNNELKNAARGVEEDEQQKLVTKEYSGMIDCLYQQYTRGGFCSLFQGMNSKLLQTVLSAAFTFLTYEQILALVGKAIE